MLTNEKRDEMIADRQARTVTVKSIEDKIICQEHPEVSGTLTICVLTMKNGFKVIGKSACAHPENFDAELGQKIAYDDAFKQIWALEGYLLREELGNNPTQG